MADLGLEEIVPVQLCVSEVRVRIAVRKLQARQGTGQVRGKMRQIRDVENELGYRRRLAVSSQGILEPVRLRRHVVYDDDLRWLAIVRRGPPPVELIRSTFVNRQLDHAAGTGERFKMAVDTDAIVKRVVGASSQEHCKIYSAGHICVLVAI